MQKEITLALISLFASPLVFANQPVTMSGPMPAIASTFAAGSSHSFTYTITNNVPKSLPITIAGLFGVVNRVTVPNDCGNTLAPAQGSRPSTCNIGIAITPNQSGVGTFVNQTFEVDYQGRKPLTAQVSFVTRASILYVSNFSANSISQCTVNLETGVISNCRNFSDPTFASPANIAINSSATFAYVSNFATDSVSICPIQTSGQLSPCVIFASAQLDGIAGSTVNNASTILYTANFNNKTLGTCLLNSGGGINQCTISAPLSLGPADIVLDPSNAFAYVTAGTVLQCPISSGALGACIASPGAPAFSSPTGITMNAAGTMLYINNAGTNTVFQCAILPGVPFLGTCTSSNPGGTFSLGFGKNATYQNSLLFVANRNSNTVSACTLDASGALVSCTAYNPDGAFLAPQGVAIN